MTSTLRRQAWLEIDLDAVMHNVAVIAGLVGDGVGVAPVVKADAYGHGVSRVAPALAGAAQALCVATLDEALVLRSEGVDGRVIVLYPVPADGLPEAALAGVELTVMSEEDLAHASRVTEADRSGVGPLALHVAVDTGLARGGVTAAGAGVLAARIEASARLRLAGLWSHLADAGDREVSAQQVALFEDASRSLQGAGVRLPPRHLAASEGIFAGTAPAFDMVRPGLAIYGVLEESLPLTEATAAPRAALRPAMALKAHAIAFSEVDTGGGVGYGGHWRASRPSRVAILPLGYGDGYARASQPGADVLLRGRRRPVVGVVSMDAVAVDVTDETEVDGQDEFVLLGHQGDESISAAELARRRNTITWEVLSSMAPRLARVYHQPADGGP